MPKARRLICKSCNGSGRIDDHVEPVRRCDDCVGRGYYHAKVKAPVVQKARVLYVHPERLIPGKKQLIAMRASQFGAGTDGIVPVPVLVRPYRTKQQAQGAAKRANLSYEQKADVIAKSLQTTAEDIRIWDELHLLTQERYRERARAILQLLGERPEGEK